MYTRDDLRKIMGIYNPEKEQALNAMGQVRSQIGDLMSDNISQILKRLDALEKGQLSPQY